MVDTPGHGDIPTHYEMMVNHAIRGETVLVEECATAIREECQGRTIGYLYDTRKGHIATHEGTHVKIDEEALDQFLDDVVAESRRVWGAIKQHEENERRRVWHEFRASHDLEPAEYSGLAVAILQNDATYGREFSETFFAAITKEPPHLDCDSAAYHIQQGHVNWHKAWQKFDWYDAFAGIDSKEAPDAGKALDVLEAAHHNDSKNGVIIARAITRQFFSDLLEAHIRESQKETVPAQILPDDAAFQGVINMHELQK